MNQKLLSLYGLKYNPFTPDVPISALHIYPKLENFCWRIENNLIKDGGFALITGDPGTGKSVALRLLSEKLGLLRDVQLGVLTHSSARLSDFYRELGDIFGVPLSPYNLWNSFKFFGLGICVTLPGTALVLFKNYGYFLPSVGRAVVQQFLVAVACPILRNSFWVHRLP